MLITLTIIGIIAALTVPTLMHKHQMHVRKTQLKKIYAQLSQAISSYAVKNGIADMNKYLTDIHGVLGASGEKKRSENAILYMVLEDSFKDLIYCPASLSQDFIKEHNIKTDKELCRKRNNSKYYYKNYDGSPHLTWNAIIGEGEDTVFINRSIMFGSEWLYNGNKEIYVDVNGLETPPNRYAMDSFGFRVTPGGQLIPCGAPGYSCGYDGNKTYRALYDENYWKQKDLK